MAFRVIGLEALSRRFSGAAGPNRHGDDVLNAARTR
jgi:hypothetical protein